MTAERKAARIVLTTGIFPPDIGGPATYVPRMAAELSRRGHEVSILTLSDSSDSLEKFGAGVDRDERTGPPHQWLRRIARGTPRPLRFVKTVRAIVEMGRSADLLFANGLYPETTIAASILRRPMVQKVVGDWAWERVTNLGWTKDGFETFQRQPAKRPEVAAVKALRTACARRAERVIVPSDYLARCVAGWGVRRERLARIYNALESPASLPAARRPFPGLVNVVTVGRLVAWKHVDGLLRALAACPGMGLAIVGDGPERAALESLARGLGIAERVLFAGSRRHVETLALMAACDVFVLNSSYEGFPHVVLEAMSVGLPVVAAAAGGTVELVHDRANGRLVEPGRNAALAEALSELAAAPAERRRLAEAARATSAHFSFERMAEETAGILMETAWATRPAS